jgi:protein-tyrosine phosphatase
MWLPADKGDASHAFHEAWQRCADERVEVACAGGKGRTGTTHACLAILDGLPPGQAVRYVREHYNPRAVETPWQRWFVRQFGRSPSSQG